MLLPVNMTTCDIIDPKRIALYRQVHDINEALAAAQEAVLRAAEALERHDSEEARTQLKAVSSRIAVLAGAQNAESPAGL